MATAIDPNLAYYNARVRSMKGGLLDRATVESLLEQQELDRVQDALMDSVYKTEMAEALSRYSGAVAIGDAAARNLAATYQGLVRRAPAELQERVSFFLMRWDLRAIKSLLRARHAGIDASEASGAMFTGPTLTSPVMHQLSEYDTMDGLIGGLIAWNPKLCRCLAAHMDRYQQKQDLSVLEDALDRNYFVDTAARLALEADDENSRMLRTALQFEIDRINLRLMFQQVERTRDGSLLLAQMLPGGTLSDGLLRQMAYAGSTVGMIELLGNTPYGKLAGEVVQFEQSRRFSAVERYFEVLLLGRLKQLARDNVFSLAVMMYFAWLKYNEVTNLRLIAQGIAGGLPVGRVRDEVLFV